MATPDKQIIIKGKRLLYGTSVKCSPEINNSSTPTFDGNITAGLGDVGWNIEIETARYETAARHQYLSDLIESMFSQPQNVTIRETVHVRGQDPYTIVDTYYGCITDGFDYEIKPDEMTVNSLKFKASRRKRKWE